MSNMKHQMEVNLGGNVARKARDFEKGIDRMSRGGSRSLKLLKSSASKAGQVLDNIGNRYTALLGGAGLGVAVKNVGDFDDRLKSVQVQAGRTNAEMDALKNQIFDLAQNNKIKLNPTEILAAFDAVIEKTGDMQLATDNLENMAVAIRASGGSGKDIGAIVAGLEKLNVRAPEDVAAAFNLLNEQGKQGSFTMKMMATEAGPMLARMAALGYEGLHAIRIMGALAQTTQATTDSAAETGTAYVALLREIVAKGKLLHDNEIKVFDQEALDQGKEKFLELDVILNNIMNATEGKMTNLGKIFGEEAQKAITNLAEGHGKEDSMFSQMMGVSPSDTQLIDDAAQKATTFNASVTQLTATLERLANSNLSGPLQEISNFLGEMDPEEINSAANSIKNVGLAVGGVVLASKAINGGLSIVNGIRALRGGKSGGAIAAATGALGGGQRVFVTNWPIGMGSGGGAMGNARNKHRGKRFDTSRFKKINAGLNAAKNTAGGSLATRMFSFLKTGGGGVGSRAFSTLKSGGKSLLKRVPYLGPLMAGAGLLSIFADEQASAAEKIKGSGGLLGNLGGAAGGMMAGAALGSFIPVIGTAIGGILGGIAGGMGGEFAGEKIAGLLSELIGVTERNGEKVPQVTVNAERGVDADVVSDQEIDYFAGRAVIGG